MPIKFYLFPRIIIFVSVKYHGTTFEYEDARNKSLLAAYNEVVNANRNLSGYALYVRVVNMPSCRFWVSEERAAIVISAMLKGRSIENMRQNNREMFTEIYNRVMELRKERPGESVYNLTFDAVNSPAPKFYLTPASAKKIINKIKRGWYEERKRKYRHLYM